MDKLKELMSQCKCGVFISVNEHRCYHEKASEKLDELDGGECNPNIIDEVRKKMIESDTVIEVQFYPNTPGGHYVIYHYDLDLAQDEALSCLQNN